MSDHTLMNEKALEELRLLELDQPGLTNDLFRTFVADAPKQMQQIDLGYVSRNPEVLRQSAHFLRSGALVLGLSALCEQSRVLEFLEPDQYGSAESDRLVAQLRAELQPVLLTLSNRLMID